jgi:deoxyadenosine/deoxycytidine kinase
MNHVIWLEGIIGCGKSTLTRQLSERLDMRAVHEPVETNPYLEDFYEAMARHSASAPEEAEYAPALAEVRHVAYAMQMYLLHERYALQQLAVAEALAGRGAILDRGLPGDRVFAKMLMRDELLTERDWATYDRAYRVMTCSLRPPSLIVFLDVDPRTALNRVQSRARDCETSVSLEYLTALDRAYRDLLAEIESGQHIWSRGMHVLRWPWNADHEPLDELVRAINLRLELGQ